MSTSASTARAVPTLNVLLTPRPVRRRDGLDGSQQVRPRLPGDERHAVDSLAPVPHQERLEHGDHADDGEPERRGTERRGVHLRRVGRGLTGRIRDEPADAAGADPVEISATIDADHGRGGSEPERRGHRRERRRESHSEQRLAPRRGVAAQQLVGDLRQRASRPRSVPTATGKNARNGAHQRDGCPLRQVLAEWVQLAAPTHHDRRQRDQRNGLGHGEIRQQAAPNNAEAGHAARRARSRPTAPTTKPTIDRRNVNHGSGEYQRQTRRAWPPVAPARTGGRRCPTTCGIAEPAVRGRICQPRSFPPSAGPSSL